MSFGGASAVYPNAHPAAPRSCAGFFTSVVFPSRMEAVNGDLREISVSLSRPDNPRVVDVYLFDGARRFGRYQVRTNADGRRDVYYSDIEGKSFSKTRKVQKPADIPAGESPVAATIERDLSDRGISAASFRRIAADL